MRGKKNLALLQNKLHWSYTRRWDLLKITPKEESGEAGNVKQLGTETLDSSVNICIHPKPKADISGSRLGGRNGKGDGW